MSNRKWNKGNPPHAGWHLCSGEWWRYFDGESWSYGARSWYVLSEVKKSANKRILKELHSNIVWCDYWPENARVSRINPDAKIEGVAG